MTEQQKLLRILLVCYYFPPVGMGGVQRPAKFAKYLARMGHEVTVIAALPSPDEVTDDTLLTDIPDDVRVIRIKTRHPRNLLRVFNKTTASPKTSGRQRGRVTRQLAAWSRLPDDKIGFIPGAMAAARNIFGAQPPDVVLTTSPPPSIHIIGRRLQRLWQTRWVADFRDPWFMAADDRLPTPLHRAIRAKVLGTTLKHTDVVVAVSPGIVDDFRRMGFTRENIEIITNGYDEDDFQDIHESYDLLTPKRFRFHLYGTISPNAPPEPFFRALSTWRQQHPDLADQVEVSHRGAVIDVDLDDLTKRYDLPQRFTSLGYAPHWFAVKELFEPHCLVLSVADRPGLRSNIPGRIFECLRSHRPILAFVPPDGAAAGILQQFAGVTIINPADENRATETINSLFNNWRPHPRPQVYTRENITEYSRERLTGRLENLFIWAAS
ncbi:glycosyltransferase family 4 protein [Candidatus Zixiibacteriota bacterium]